MEDNILFSNEEIVERFPRLHQDFLDAFFEPGQVLPQEGIYNQRRLIIYLSSFVSFFHRGFPTRSHCLRRFEVLEIVFACCDWKAGKLIPILNN